jgi:hypothetical protein
MAEALGRSFVCYRVDVYHSSPAHPVSKQPDKVAHLICVIYVKPTNDTVAGNREAGQHRLSLVPSLGRGTGCSAESAAESTRHSLAVTSSDRS